ncbi:hypothetical protein OS493_000909 [Desmophyllum pertusum]|uniref:Uncharacterized protein n=1 Tax=Desmophyllum pertusum TaxID=174260 RepID=A0A9W9ZU86_9CNID|nr:hypothetical protein OS493_000909 [Desmophyllum pertusum]
MDAMDALRNNCASDNRSSTFPTTILEQSAEVQSANARSTKWLWKLWGRSCFLHPRHLQWFPKTLHMDLQRINTWNNFTVLSSGVFTVSASIKLKGPAQQPNETSTNQSLPCFKV